MLSISCNSQEKEINEEMATQIGEYVTNVFEDSKGNIWLGTLQNGIAKYNGEELKYYTTKDGLPSDRATRVIEDDKGTYWISTGAGLCKFDGEHFTNFPVTDDPSSNTISNLLIDSKGIFWVGTWSGVYQFDGKTFKKFPIPYPKVTTPINEDTRLWITEIDEDAEGNIWFGRDGFGACKYNGTSFTHLLKKDGLHSNNITEIQIDNDGDIWFGSRVAEKDNPDPDKRTGKGGINKLTKNGIISFPEIEGFNDAPVYEIYKDNSKNIWIGTTKNGVYRFDGKEFKNYKIPISTMCILQDSKGKLWVSGAGGLYSIDKKGAIINITTKGPWE